MTVAPLREWPGTLTPRRRVAGFSASWSATLSLLRSELKHLGAKNTELLVAIRPDDFRLDGRPRANARQEHPGVVLSFDSKVGRLSYAVDTFTGWQDNVRGIAKSLEALRMVDRYGVTKHGEQYRGFMAIEANAAPAGFATAEEALQFLARIIADEWEGGRVDTRLSNARALLRGAMRRTHPDTGGDAATFQRVTLAEAKLREAGVI